MTPACSVEIHRQNMPTTSTFTTPALSSVEGAAEALQTAFYAPNGVIRNGNNLLAVEVCVPRQHDYRSAFASGSPLPLASSFL